MRTTHDDIFEFIHKRAKRVGRELVEALLILFFALHSPHVPAWAKSTALGALAYFVLPADAVPDVIPLVGWSDDAAVVLAAVATILVHVDECTIERARRRADAWFGPR